MLSVCALEERASDKKREETGVVDESEVKQLTFTKYLNLLSSPFHVVNHPIKHMVLFMKVCVCVCETDAEYLS